LGDGDILVLGKQGGPNDGIVQMFQPVAGVGGGDQKDPPIMSRNGAQMLLAYAVDDLFPIGADFFFFDSCSHKKNSFRNETVIIYNREISFLVVTRYFRGVSPILFLKALEK
jgi:hypothetical protein